MDRLKDIKTISLHCAYHNSKSTRSVRRTENTMFTRKRTKGQTTIYKTLYKVVFI